MDPGFFQIVIPAGHKLVLVINDPSTNNAGLGKNFDVLVEGFTGTQFTDPAPVPEPATSHRLAGTSATIGE